MQDKHQIENNNFQYETIFTKYNSMQTDTAI